MRNQCLKHISVLSLVAFYNWIMLDDTFCHYLLVCCCINFTGYYRFSDVFYPREDGFTNCTATPGARLTVTDLSAYNTNSNESGVR